MLTLLDVMGPRETTGAILGFFMMDEATILRLVSTDIKQVVEWYPWDERTFGVESLIKRDLINWKKSFPFARSALIRLKYYLSSDECLELRGVDYAYCDDEDCIDPEDMPCTSHIKGRGPCLCCGDMTSDWYT